MRDASFIATRLVFFKAEREQPKQQKSNFRIILEALHHSRRLQAERTFHQYRHLIQKAESNNIRELNNRSGAKDHVDK